MDLGEGKCIKVAANGSDGVGSGSVVHTGTPTAGHVAVFGVDGDHIADGGALGAASGADILRRSDGDDSLADELGLPPESREVYSALNAGIKDIAARHGYMLSDLVRLFHGHGVNSPDTWYVGMIEPTYKGASAIAQHWYQLAQGVGTPIEAHTG